ncbi:MAG: formylmethanofuran dehydrogenase subunit E family protein [Candidatus Omnitrophota bacterium]|nr:formylmethanofuran dehydrogenase subunit E family protein [Candidatus Omnitrophota bacterium]
MISLKSAEKFHGHLGPWLALGLLMGDYGLKKINARKYFGLEVIANGLNKKPRSCLVDGLQLSTGCTLGKGNIKINGYKKIKVTFKNCDNKRIICLGLRRNLLEELKKKMSHRQAQKIACELFKIKPTYLFEVLTKV